MLSYFYTYKNVSVLFFLTLFLITSHSLTLAQSGTVKGRVIDKISNEPLAFANMVIEGTSIGTSTDAKGNFLLRNVPVGNQVLVISYVGYNTIKVNLDISANITIEDDFSLEPITLEGQTVEITVQAEGQLGAINEQLSSNTIANVVAKDRIKELPDVNAAETIGRLPGVSIERSGGEANKISIRGLSPKYNLITVNGVRVPSTNTGVVDDINTVSNDRSVDLSLISSNMLDGIILKKANTADMDADALGGTIDLKLKEAQEEPSLYLSAQGGYNALQKYYGNYNFTGSFSKRFFNGNLGAIANFNVDNYDRSADKLSGGYHPENTLEGERVIAIERLTLREETVNRDRIGGSLVFDYRIPEGRVTGNAFYNNLKDDDLFRINEFSTSAPGESNRHYYDMEDRGGTTSVFTGMLGLEQNFGWLHYEVGAYRTNSNTDRPNEHTWRFTQEAGTFSNPNFPPGTDPKLVPTYANNYDSLTRLSEVWIWDTKSDQNETGIQFNIQLPFILSENINGYVKSGAKFRWLDRMNDIELHGRHGLQYGGGEGNQMLLAIDNAYPEWGVDSLVELYGYLPITPFLDNYSRDNFLNGDYPLGFTYNQSMMEKITEVLDTSGYVLRYSIGSIGGDYDGIEQYRAGYIMSEFKLWKYVTFLPGIRYEWDYSKYNGWRFRETTPNNIQGPPADLEQLSVERKHDFWLPTIHLIGEPSDWLKIRLAYTKTLTRPDFLQIAPIARINSFQDRIRANNSKLKPSVSTNYDAAVSVYNNYIGLFSISGFYKDIKDLIFFKNYKFRTGIRAPEGANIPESWYASQPEGELFINNPGSASYKGFEIEWQTHLWYLPEPLNGIVLNANFTRIFSEIESWVPNIQQDTLIRRVPPVWSYKVIDSSRTARMPDQPAYIVNLTLGYDFDGFSARLSYLYQTDKVRSIDSYWPILDSFTGAYVRWDLTLQQKLDWGLTVFVNLANINGEPDLSYRADTFQSVSYTEYYGFTMDVGLRFNL